MSPLETIVAAEKVVKDMRDYSRSQKELWQRIPLLALEADGRTGFSDNYSRAYRSGFWALDESVSGGDYLVYVDLATGELVDAYSASSSISVCDVDVPKDSALTPAREEEVLKLALNLDGLDAQQIVTSLEEEARAPYSSYYDLKEQEAWRTETRTELNLPQFYVR